MKLRPSSLLVAIFAVVFSTTHVSGQTFAETGDAGVNESGAQIVPPLMNRVTGTLKPGTLGPFSGDPIDVDVFAFTLTTTTSAVIDASVLGANANLLLLKEGFLGLAGDDDSGGVLNSQISITLAPGTYYVAVGLNYLSAYPFGAIAAGDYVWNDDYGLLGPVESAIPIDFIASQYADPDDTTGQTYEILFNFQTAVTGLDLSAGKSLSKLKGVDVLGKSGKGQTAKIRGSRKAKFRFFLTNTGDDRNVKAALLGSAKRLPLVIIEKAEKRKNVTASLQTGKYKKLIGSGTSRQFLVSLASPTALKKRLIKMRVQDRDQTTISDVAAGSVTIK